MFEIVEIGIFDLIDNNIDQSLNRCDFETYHWILPVFIQIFMLSYVQNYMPT